MDTAVAPVSTASAVHALLWNLADLPDTDAIAAHLHGQGARGRRGESGCCPVSDYVWRSLGVRVLVCPAFWMGDADAQVIPGRVGEFVYRFDRGLYPELDVEVER